MPEIILPSDSHENEMPSANYQVYKGVFVVSKDKISFRDCRYPEKDMEVVDSTGSMKELYQSLFLHSPAFPFEYVYVELKGTLSSDETDGSKKMVVFRVIDMEQTSYKNACIPYDFWVIGKEWSIQISQEEGLIAMKDFKKMTVEVFEYFPPKILSENLFIYTSNNYATQTSIKITIAKQTCSQDESEPQYDYSAAVLINGIQFNGCVVKGTFKRAS